MGTSSFEDLPQELLLESFALYCDVQHKITVSKLNRRLQFLFKEPVLHQQLLELTAKYKKNIPPLADQIKKAAVEKPRVTNPILKQIDTLLDQNPILALKPGQFSDGSGHFFCCSTLVYACWSLNWVVYEMIYRALRAIPNSHACTAALTEAKRQEIALARKAFDYDLYLWSYQWRGYYSRSSTHTNVTEMDRRSPE